MQGKSLNIIADIAGRYDELQLLLAKMPQGEEVILLGDLHDRGSQSKEVIQWAIDNKIKTVKSNHGDMLIAAYSNHKKGSSLSEDIYLFEYNGGFQTLVSYGGSYDDIPESHIQYLRDCIPYVKTDDLILTHAPLHPNWNLEDASLMDDFTRSRVKPKRRKQFQIHGHDTYFKEHSDKDGVFAICLDDSGNRKLTGIHWPSRDIFTQDYL